MHSLNIQFCNFHSVCRSVHIDGMRGAAPGDELFSGHQLRMDAVRRLLFAYGARVGLHIRTTPGPMADGVWLEHTCATDHCVRPGAWLQRRRRTCIRVSATSLSGREYMSAMCALCVNTLGAHRIIISVEGTIC